MICTSGLSPTFGAPWANAVEEDNEIAAITHMLFIVISPSPSARSPKAAFSWDHRGYRDVDLKRPAANHSACDFCQTTSWHCQLTKSLIVCRRPRNRAHFFAFSPSSTRRRMASGRLNRPSCLAIQPLIAAICWSCIRTTWGRPGPVVLGRPIFTFDFLESRNDLPMLRDTIKASRGEAVPLSASALTRPQRSYLSGLRLIACIARHGQLRPKSNPQGGRPRKSSRKISDVKSRRKKPEMTWVS